MENNDVNYVRKKLKSLTGLITDSVFQRFQNSHKAMPAMELFLIKCLIVKNFISIKAYLSYENLTVTFRAKNVSVSDRK